MTVRVWLSIADCWQCGTSIELTEEQEQEAERLLDRLRQSDEEGLGESHPSAMGRVDRPADSNPAAPHVLLTGADLASGSDPAMLRVDTPLAAPVPRMRPRAERSPHRRSPLRRASDFVDSFPAWLVSIVLHLVLLTLLALWHFGEQTEEQMITLSTTLSPVQEEGGDVAVVMPEHELAFDLPLPVDAELSDRKIRDVLIRADQDARELRLDPGADEPNLPPLSAVKRVIGGGRGEGPGRPVAGRDPRIRVEIVRQEGGTTMTEAAVARGLRWLAEHQEPDGSWSLHEFDHRPGCSCGGTGSIRSDSAATSLALLPFLGAGQTHLVGRYRDCVSSGLRWLLARQRRNGDLRADSDHNAGMYAQGQGAIVLCEAYLMTGDESLRGPAQRAIDFIVDAQHAEGGWRYAPGQPGDTSVLGWQLMALQSARAANLNVPEETLELASQYLDTVSHEGGARYSYMAGHPPSHVMTAEALLCRMYLGWTRDTPGLEEGVNYLVQRHPPLRRDPNIYYWYYATQAIHHVGGPPWTTWNTHMREVLVNSQERRGHVAGSWTPRGDHGSAGGRIYMTALAVCTLEVYYRHLPLFRQLKMD